ncbi:MAG: hypothetical protein K1X78_02800 [Verrucomicrobiaceae bacterium]|nr:hypothetical protein [Verrucomicrobiaceae bacterium]
MSARSSFCPRTSVLLAILLTALVPAGLRSENVPLDHPCTETVKKYLAAVVAQDWKTAATMLLPTSLERKQKETIAIVRMAPTMTEENQMLEKLGAKEISDLEKMSAIDFYVADRMAVHQKMKISPEVKKKKEETLNISVVSLGGEDSNKVIHAVVRTSQETVEAKIEELFLISMVQDKDDTKKWLIVPDMMRPITTPLRKGDAAADGAEAGGTDKPGNGKKSPR